MEVSHDLLVELEENNICRLKNKLLRYFQSKKSNGGECEVDYKEGDRTAVLRFRREQDQKGVLEKGSHEITVDKCVLKMTVRLLTNEATVQATSSHAVAVKSEIGDNQAKREECVPAPEGQAHAGGGNDEPAAEAACPTSALLANIPENNQNFLKLLVRNILKDGDSKNPVFSFEFLPDMTSAVVTFQSGKESRREGEAEASGGSCGCLRLWGVVLLPVDKAKGVISVAGLWMLLREWSKVFMKP
ncbi:hypothetical protein D4764_01G0003240 [Takifugu flavidus]|uniref:Poly [ADP-ribose] polymerase 14 n=1 Tax=Takifugu flavidus TaxID=433684 RepID=A0A5C6PNI0_9TELE|nr:hypothetical protein D4764_01G0003240 [Takifugu flavidus]